MNGHCKYQPGLWVHGSGALARSYLGWEVARSSAWSGANHDPSCNPSILGANSIISIILPRHIWCNQVQDPLDVIRSYYMRFNAVNVQSQGIHYKSHCFKYQQQCSHCKPHDVSSKKRLKKACIAADVWIDQTPISGKSPKSSRWSLMFDHSCNIKTEMQRCWYLGLGDLFS